MTYEELKHFISEKMSLSHVYQPVMLKTLLCNEGEAANEVIAENILARDPSQLEYYVDRVKNMVGKVLTNDNGVTERIDGGFRLPGFSELRTDEVHELIRLCDERLEAYEARRQGKQWDHRRRNRKVISGTVRHEVLKRAMTRCELCGISMEKKSLEVDHIVPKSLGGADDITNYQALCYTCNASKGNRDDTDFRGITDIYADKRHGCLFCDLAQDGSRTIAENTLAFLIEDAYPVTEGHALAIPKRHVDDYFGLVQAEINAINQLLTSYKSELLEKDPTITGFNIGANCGEDAGQTIFHCHVHLIPRRTGDVDDSTGGVRAVIPEKANYKKS